MEANLFIELSVILVITIAVTAVMRLLKQPVIIGYILSGIVAGPFLLNVITSADTFTAFAQQGVALLLFLVGLNINPKVIKEVGKISLITGIGQVLFTTGVGFLFSRMMGIDTIPALYLSFALAFSSTIVIMKLLSDKKDTEKLYGRISIGFLIVQDLIVILFLLVISSFSNPQDIGTGATFLEGLGLVTLLIILTVYVLPKVTALIARSQEFLFLFALTWCFAVASVFHYLGFSIEAGALLAGMALSASSYHYEISAKMRPLRDFFLILFFIMMGSQMLFENISAYIVEIILLSLFVLIGNPIIVMVLMGFLGYTKKTSFHAGLTVAQISEFSLIIVTMGIGLGHLTGEMLSVVTSIALITFAGSTYLILYSHKIYPALEPWLSVFERKGSKVDANSKVQQKNHEIILFGYNQVGFHILESLKKSKRKFLIVDYDPQIMSSAQKQGYDFLYGDASNADLLEDLNLTSAKMIVSTMSDIEPNLLIINKIKKVNPKAIIAVVSHSMDHTLRLYDEGATYVIMPHDIGGKHFSTLIDKHQLNLQRFLKEKVAHIKHIHNKKKIHHHHPTFH